MPEETDHVDQSARVFHLIILKLHSQVTAMRIALEDAGLITQEVKNASMAQSMEIWGPAIARAEKLVESSEESSLLELLRDFEGPLQ